MQLDAAADPATVSQNAVKQESRPPSSKRSNAKPKLSPSKHHQSGKTSAASSHKAVKTEHSPLHGMAKGKAARGDCLAEVGDADMLAPKREGESADLSMRENRLQGEHAQGKLQEVQEGQGSPVVPSRLRRKVT